MAGNTFGKIFNEVPLGLLSIVPGNQSYFLMRNTVPKHLFSNSFNISRSLIYDPYTQNAPQ